MPVALGLELKNWPFRYIATSPDLPRGANAQLTFGDRLMFCFVVDESGGRASEGGASDGGQVGFYGT